MKYQKKNSILSKIKSQIKLSESAAAADFENYVAGDYDIILINSYKELHEKFGDNKTGYKGYSEWWHSNDEELYTNWTDYGTKYCFVLAKKGWENIQPPDPKTTNAYDEYGTSLIAILVNVKDGELLNAMLRWNSIINPRESVPGTSFDHAFLDWGDLNTTVGFNVKAVVEKELKRIRTDIDNIMTAINDKLKAVTEITGSTLTVDEQLFITHLDIPNNITSIGGGAFSFCTHLKSITIPDSVTSIGREAFYYCERLESITIPDSVTTIGNDVFRCCYSLKTVTIGNSVKSIGDDAFTLCTRLKNVTFKGKTMYDVRSMEEYPWGIRNPRQIITASQS